MSSTSAKPIATLRSATGIPTGRLAIWWLMASELVIFGGLLASYIMHRLGHAEFANYAAHTNTLAGAFNTLVLLSSSLTAVLAHHAAEHGDGKKASRYLWLTILGAATFLCVKGVEWTVEIKAGARGPWPPPWQPRLPVEDTLWNTAALLASGVALLVAHAWFRRAQRRALARLVVCIALGLTFVGLQGVEWIALLAEGLTLTSSAHGSFFYLIVGAHGVHALCALLALTWLAVRMAKGSARSSELVTVELFWAFVVLLWPFLYAHVYF